MSTMLGAGQGPCTEELPAPSTHGPGTSLKQLELEIREQEDLKTEAT